MADQKQQYPLKTSGWPSGVTPDQIKSVLTPYVSDPAADINVGTIDNQQGTRQNFARVQITLALTPKEFIILSAADSANHLKCQGKAVHCNVDHKFTGPLLSVDDIKNALSGAAAPAAAQAQPATAPTTAAKPKVEAETPVELEVLMYDQITPDGYYEFDVICKEPDIIQIFCEKGFLFEIAGYTSFQKVDSARIDLNANQKVRLKIKLVKMPRGQDETLLTMRLESPAKNINSIREYQTRINKTH